MGNSRKFAAFAAAAAIVLATPAQACWTNSEEDAAKIANLNMMMMVTALRCRKGPDDFLGDYNSFVKNNNRVIGAQNGAVRGHFARVGGAGNADAAMDKFVIGLANSYGSGHPSMDCGELKRVAKGLSAAGHSAATLSSIADAVVSEAKLAGGLCSVNIASK